MLMVAEVKSLVDVITYLVYVIPVIPIIILLFENSKTLKLKVSDSPQQINQRHHYCIK